MSEALAIELKDQLSAGELVTADGKSLINPAAILAFVEKLIAQYAKRDVVMAQFETVWAKVAATDWPAIKNPKVEAAVKFGVHAIAVHLINQLPA